MKRSLCAVGAVLLVAGCSGSSSDSAAPTNTQTAAASQSPSLDPNVDLCVQTAMDARDLVKDRYDAALQSATAQGGKFPTAMAAVRTFWIDNTIGTSNPRPVNVVTSEAEAIARTNCS